MPIVLSHGEEADELVAAPFANEADLEQVVIGNPTLLCAEGDSALTLVASQVVLPNASRLDILLVDADGLPVAVEVKLGRNSQARREIVGQIVDYVSTLTSLTVDELDQVVNGGLETAIRSRNTEEDELERIWQAVGRNLRAGLSRFALVLDEVPDELRRIVRFLADRSNLDLRLVEILRYPTPNGGTIYVPNVTVRATSPVTLPQSADVPTGTGLLQAVVDAYRGVASEPFLPRGTSASYRLIRGRNWPFALHYEFSNYGDGIGVGLHLESEKVRPLSAVLQRIAENGLPDLGYPVTLGGGWPKAYKLQVQIPRKATPLEVAQAMWRFVELTHEEVSSALAKQAQREALARLAQREASGPPATNAAPGTNTKS